METGKITAQEGLPIPIRLFFRNIALDETITSDADRQTDRQTDREREKETLIIVID